MSLPLHGANPQFLYKEMGIKQPEAILDFSVNTNPFRSPFQLRDYLEEIELAMSQYPDPEVSRLKEAVQARENISQDHILFGNGGSECIYLLANYFNKKKICIVEPTFGEYRKACTAFHCRIESFVLKEYYDWDLHEEEMSEFLIRNDVIFICNPNNPSGVIYSQEKLLSVVKEAEKHGTICVIDEAFYDFCKEPTGMASYIHEFSNLIIVRSLTKMYSIPGVRLGYILANEKLIHELKEFQPQWSVNGIAQVIGEIILNNLQFAETTATTIQNERNRLFPKLQALGYYISDSKVNFFLLREQGEKKDTNALLTFLLEQGIVPRHTYNFIGLKGQYLRLAIKTARDNDALVDALSRWKKQC